MGDFIKFVLLTVYFIQLGQSITLAFLDYGMEFKKPSQTFS